MYYYRLNPNELYHHGVKGMKWGRRKAVVTSGNGRGGSSSNSDYKNSPEHQAKVAKRKKAVKIGAAVAGTALAAYGTYRVAKLVQNKRSNAAMAKASAYLDKNFMERVGKSEWSNGRTQLAFRNRNGDISFRTEGARNKDIGKQNARVVAKARQIYSDNTSTRLDKGVSKIVNAGDNVGNAAKRAGQATTNAAKRAGEKATAPIYKKNANIARERGHKEAESLSRMFFGDSNVRSQSVRKNGFYSRTTVNEQGIINNRVNNSYNDSLKTAVGNIRRYNQAQRYAKRRGKR